MKLTRRFLALLLVLSMSLSMVTPAFASETETEPVVEDAAVVETEAVEVIETEAAEPETEAPVETETIVEIVEVVEAAVDAVYAAGTEEDPIYPEWEWNDERTEATASVTVPRGESYYIYIDYSYVALYWGENHVSTYTEPGVYGPITCPDSALSMRVDFKLVDVTPVEGSEENPAYPAWEWNDAGTEASFTVSVPAGETYYFYVVFSGMTMAVNGEEAGIVNGNGRMPELHTITNDGAEEANYTVKLVALAGTMDNPAELTNGTATAEIAAGSQGYFYTYTAPADGTVIFEISAADSEGNDLGWAYVINNLTTYQYGDTQWSDSDPVVNPAEIAVNEGDELQIMVNTYDPAAWDAPAGIVSVYVSFEYPLGSEMNPITEYYMGTGPINGEAAAGATVYYNIFGVGNMVMTVADAADLTVTVAGVGYTADENGVISAEMPAVMGRMPVSFSVTNTGAEAAQYAMEFAYPVGHMMNPEVLEDLAFGYTVLEEHDNDGYFYTYTATETGYVSLGITYTDEGVEGDITITNNSTSAQRNLSGDGQNGLVIMPVTAGDVLTITVAALPDESYNYPAAEIAWSGTVSAEIPGTTEENPTNITSLLVWDENNTAATASVTVSGGTTGYFAINNVGGMELTIDGGDPITLTGDRMNPSTFSISNDGEETVTYSLSIAYPVGTQMNPEYLWRLNYITASLEEGNNQGYYFTYTAPEAGTVVLTGEQIEGVEYDIVIYNENSYAQSSMYENGDYTVSMPVAAGDVLAIQFVVRPDDSWNYLAADIVAYGTFLYPVGHMQNPEVLEDLMGYAAVAEGDYDGYFYTYTATETGYVSLGITYIDEGVEGDISITNNSTSAQRNLSGDGQNGLVIMPVTAGDVLSINVAALPDENYNYPAAEIYWSGAVSAEIPGTTEENPINITALLVWDEDYTSATASVTVSGGTTGYFAVDRVGGMELTIDGGDPITLTGNMWTPSTFSISNDGEDTVTYSLSIAYPVGTQMNPEYLWYIRYITASLEEGNNQGYYFTYTAPEDGTVVLNGEQIEGVEYDIVIYNENSYAQSSMFENGDYTVSMPVAAGDVLSIQFVALPDDSWNYPAADIVAYGTFLYPVGHMQNPEPVSEGEFSVELEEDSQGYYYSYTAEVSGKLFFTMLTEDNWTYCLNNNDGGIYNETQWSDGGSATDSIFVAAGQTVEIMVNTYDPDSWSAPAGTISFVLDMKESDYEIVSGKKLTLTFTDPVTGKKVAGSKLNWSIEETYVYRPDGVRVQFEDTAAYATLKNGTLTTKACGDQVHMVIKATLKTDETVSMTYYVDILPAATKLSIWAEGQPMVGTIDWDVNPSTIDPETEYLDLDAYCFPSNAKQDVTWKSSNAKVMTVDEEGVIRPVWDAKKGEYKTGTVTITATAKDGSGKKASFKVKISKLASFIEISRQDGEALVEIPTWWDYEWDEELQEYVQIVYESVKGTYAEAGSKLKLTATIDANASDKTVNWECGSAYAKVSKGTVTIAKDAPQGQMIYVYAYDKEYRTGDYIVISVKNTTVTVDAGIYSDGQYVRYANDKDAYFDVSTITSAEDLPSAELYGYAIDADDVHTDINDWRISGSAAELKTVSYWSEWIDPDGDDIYDVEVKHYDVENAPNGAYINTEATLSPVWDAKKNACKTGTVTITAVASDGKTKSSFKVTMVNMVNTLEIKTKDGKNIADAEAETFWNPYLYDYETGEYGVWHEGKVAYATAGKALTLTAEVNQNAANKKIYWWADCPEYPDAVKMSNGKLTVSKDLPTETVVWVEAYSLYNNMYVMDAWIPVVVSPRATNVHLRADFEGWGDWNMKYVSNTTVEWDVSQAMTLNVSALVYPFDASQDVTWTTSNKNIATVQETVNDWGESVTSLVFTGKKFGKLTVTATAADGSKVKTSFTLNVNRTVQNMDLPDGMVTTAGKTLALTKSLTFDPAPTVKNILWSMQMAEFAEDGSYELIDVPADVATLDAKGNLKVNKKLADYAYLVVTATDELTGVTAETKITLCPKAMTGIVVKDMDGNVIKSGATMTIEDGSMFGFTVEPKNSADKTYADAKGGWYNAFSFATSKPNVATYAVTQYGVYVIQTLEAGSSKITVKALDGSNKSFSFNVKFSNAPANP